MRRNGAAFALFSFLPLGLAGHLQAEPPGAIAEQQPGFAPVRPSIWDWYIPLPTRELGTTDWRDWVAGDDLSTRTRGGRRPRISGATVVVADRFLDEAQERVLELNTTWAPVLAQAFKLGWQSPYTAEMLSEFMGMHGTNFHPPSIPSVWYNGLMPYWVQQGWASSTGVQVTARPSPQHMALYPNRR